MDQDEYEARVEEYLLANKVAANAGADHIARQEARDAHEAYVIWRMLKELRR